VETPIAAKHFGVATKSATTVYASQFVSLQKNLIHISKFIMSVTFIVIGYTLNSTTISKWNFFYTFFVMAIDVDF